MKYILLFSPFLVLVLLIVIFLLLQKPSLYLPPKSRALPTPTSVQSFEINTSKTKPPLPYVYIPQSKIDLLTTNKQPLSPSDEAVKQQIIAALGTNNTLVIATETFSMEYLSAPDEILIDLLTSDLSQGKSDAIGWLEAQGLSKEGICHLPVFFYVDPSVVPQLQNTSVVFNPLPDGC